MRQRLAQNIAKQFKGAIVDSYQRQFGSIWRIWLKALDRGRITHPIGQLVGRLLER